jgi:hypothetical protein
MENRQCIKCGEVKDVCMFRKNSPTRILNICKKCYNKRSSELQKKRVENDEYRKRKNKERGIRTTKQCESDPIFYFKRKLKRNIYLSFKRGGFLKESIATEILGADWDVIINYFEKRFQEGMTWENHGKWHIDHINPTSTATSVEDIIRLNHYTNLQPLWAKDNLKKSNTITPLSMVKESFPYEEVKEIKSDLSKH